MKIGLLAAGLLIGSLASVPAFAQMGNSSAVDPAVTSPPSTSEHGTPNKPMKMTAAEDAKMKSCMKMSHDMMMKDDECVRLKAMHEDMAKNKGGVM